jgi:hypothetical protein
LSPSVVPPPRAEDPRKSTPPETSRCETGAIPSRADANRRRSASSSSGPGPTTPTAAPTHGGVIGAVVCGDPQPQERRRAVPEVPGTCAAKKNEGNEGKVLSPRNSAVVSRRSPPYAYSTERKSLQSTSPQPGVGDGLFRLWLLWERVHRAEMKSCRAHSPPSCLPEAFPFEEGQATPESRPEVRVPSFAVVGSPGARGQSPRSHVSDRCLSGRCCCWGLARGASELLVEFRVRGVFLVRCGFFVRVGGLCGIGRSSGTCTCACGCGCGNSRSDVASRRFLTRGADEPRRRGTPTRPAPHARVPYEQGGKSACASPFQATAGSAACGS